MRSILYTKSWYRRYNGHWKVKGPAMSDFGVWETYVTYRMYSTRVQSKKNKSRRNRKRREEIELVHRTQRIWGGG